MPRQWKETPVNYDKWKTKSDPRASGPAVGGPGDPGGDDAFDDDQPEDQEDEPPYCDHCLADFAAKRLGCEFLCASCFEEMIEGQKADTARDISKEQPT